MLQIYSWRHRSRVFPTPFTDNVLYFQDDRRTPLVIFGQSGCGKTSVMSMVAKEAWHISSQSNVVIRYIATTPNASHIRLLLHSVCEQVCKMYGRDPCTIRMVCRVLTDLEMILLFTEAVLAQWSKTKL